MNSNQDTEVYNFLSYKILTSERRKQREVLFFWTDLIVGSFERNYAASGLDSEDRAYIQGAVDTWFYSTLLELLHELKDTGEDMKSCRDRIKRAVRARVHHIIKDLLFERKRVHGRNLTKEKGKRKEEKKEVADSIHPQGQRINRTSLRMSHLSPELQDAVFMDSFSDAETQYLFREVLLQKDNGCDQSGIVLTRKSKSVEASLPDEDSGVFLARQAHLETLRVRLANSGRSGADGA